MEINGKEYKINIDTTLGTEKLVARIIDKPDDPKNIGYMEHILKDILIPSPTTKELNKFRKSAREIVFEEFVRLMGEENTESKKKHSLL